MAEVVDAGETLLELKGLQQELGHEPKLRFPAWRLFRWLDRLYAIVVVGSGVGVLLIAGAITDNATVAFLIASPLVIGLVALLVHQHLTLWLWRRAGRPGAIGDYDLRFTDQGFVLAYASGTTFVPWSAVVQSAEDRRWFGVSYSPGQSAIMAKERLTTEQVEAVRGIMRRYTDFVTLH